MGEKKDTMQWDIKVCLKKKFGPLASLENCYFIFLHYIYLLSHNPPDSCGPFGGSGLCYLAAVSNQMSINESYYLHCMDFFNS